MTEQQRKEVLMFTQKNKSAVLATVSPEGEPQAATITHLMDNDFTLYFVTKKESRKFQNITHNPRVSIVIGTDPSVPTTVQIQGRATVIPKPHHFIIAHLTKKINLTDVEWWPLLKAQKGEHEFIKVEIDWMRWLNLSTTGNDETFADGFQQLIP